ncbi:MAG: VOC family protein [Lysobacter sp.]|nr:VOC family protein [Lysobacter sp.]
MIDHVGFKVSDFERSKAFYTKALAPLGYGLLMEITPDMTGTDSRHAGFGKDRKPSFWFGNGETTRGGLHIALVAATRADVDAFHAAALAVGATDNGAPGLRPIYHPGYYGAFVLDPDGHDIEAVCHVPE